MYAHVHLIWPYIPMQMGQLSMALQINLQCVATSGMGAGKDLAFLQIS